MYCLSHIMIILEADFLDPPLNEAKTVTGLTSENGFNDY